MGWWNDLTTSIGSALTSLPTEEDIAENNKRIRKVAAETRLNLEKQGYSVDIITGDPIKPGQKTSWNENDYASNEFKQAINNWESRKNKVIDALYYENPDLMKILSDEEKDLLILRTMELAKTIEGTRYKGEDAVRAFNEGRDGVYTENEAISKAVVQALEEQGDLVTGMFKTDVKSEVQEYLDKKDEQKSNLIDSDNSKDSNVVINDNREIEVKKDEPEYEPIKRQLKSGSEEQYFGNGKDILSAINDAYKIVTDEENIDKKTDYRVSLNVIPMNNLNNTYVTESEFNQRLGYVLGDSEGFLYKLYNKTAGLVFPYTPSITMNHSVNYEQTDISHSNLSIQNYQNTPPPSLSINADFTADTPENAIYMVGAIWFFRSLTKMDFGLRAQQPGMPPPVLYLNGWGALVNNIPVVISSFNVSLPKDKQYVSVQIGNTTQWVPTKITMEIGLKIQPNIEKYKQQFDLQGYKRGDFGGLSDVNIGNVFLEESTKFKKITDVYDNYEVDKNLNYKPIGTSTKSSLESEKAYNARKTSGAGWTW